MASTIRPERLDLRIETVMEVAYAIVLVQIASLGSLSLLNIRIHRCSYLCRESELRWGMVVLGSTCRSRSEPALENLALRQQLSTFKQRDSRPRLRKSEFALIWQPSVDAC